MTNKRNLKRLNGIERPQACVYVQHAYIANSIVPHFHNLCPHETNLLNFLLSFNHLALRCMGLCDFGCSKKPTRNAKCFDLISTHNWIDSLTKNAVVFVCWTQIDCTLYVNYLLHGEWHSKRKIMLIPKRAFDKSIRDWNGMAAVCGLGIVCFLY